MKDLGAAKTYLGIRIIRDRPNHILTIDQESYIEETIEKFGMTNAHPTNIPLPSSVHYEPSKVEATPSLRHEYQSIIGTLLYVMLGTRPDISFAVTRLSSFNQNPSQLHLNAARHILKYLKGTKDYKIKYDGASRAGLLGYSDSDWAENRDDRHSTSGYVFLMAKGAVSWVSRKQKTVSLSSTEAEYMGLSDSCRQTAWLRSFQQELGFAVNKPTPLCGDNQGSIFLAVNPAHDRRTKHIDVKYHYIREFVENKQAFLYYVNTKDMIADNLTKALPYPAHDKHRKAMGLTSGHDK